MTLCRTGRCGNLGIKTKKEKEAKRKKWEGLWKLTPLWKSAGADSHSRLEKDFAKNAQLFHSSAQALRLSTKKREF
jgi:hypothetical protein